MFFKFLIFFTASLEGKKKKESNTGVHKNYDQCISENCEEQNKACFENDLCHAMQSRLAMDPKNPPGECKEGDKKCKLAKE